MNTLKKITLAAGLVLAATINAQEPKPQVVTQAPTPKQEAPAKPAERWEYKNAIGLDDDAPMAENFLNSLGAQGWELVSVNVVPGFRGRLVYRYTFKRKL